MADRVYLTPKMTILMRIATHETNKHTNDRARHVDRVSASPCERALLAEHNLAAL
jgi:hypothetical protein